jgi:hypothetical protein
MNVNFDVTRHASIGTLVELDEGDSVRDSVGTADRITLADTNFAADCWQQQANRPVGGVRLLDAVCVDSNETGSVYLELL